MSYRSDYDALAAQNAALERKLKEAQEERDRAIKERDEALQPELEPSIQSEAPSIEASPTEPARVLSWLIGGGVVVIGTGYLAYSMLNPSMNRHVSPTWKATVQKASGTFSPGDLCELKADFSGNGSDRLHADRMKLICGTKSLLDEEPNGQWEVWEGHGANKGSFKYRLKSIHDASFPIRPLLNIDTKAKSATFLGADGSKIVFDVEEYSSLLTGPPIFEGNEPTGAGFDLYSWSGKITSDSGDLPLGASCEVKIAPRNSKSQNCKIEVDCGATNLYGAGDMGYNPCRVEGGTPVFADDNSTEGDPILLLDLRQGTVKISGDREVLISGEKVLP